MLNPSLSFLPLMLPTLVEAPPIGEGWTREIKHDGYRTLLLIEGGRSRALSRQGRDWTFELPGICEAAAQLTKGSAVLDGETVALDADGRSDFGALRRAITRREPLVYMAFDLLHLDGEDLRLLPLVERRARLIELLDGSEATLGFSESFDGDAAALFKAAGRLGLEPRQPLHRRPH
jgi:bifunctional non-homologous end joining protein LigD